MSAHSIVPTRVLFVCLGNICRSPLGHGILEHLVRQRGLAGFEVDSCGTGPWHEGEPPNRHSQAVAKAHGIDISRQRARQVRAADFDHFDWILAMDRSNQADLLHMAPAGARDRVRLLLEFGADPQLRDVPDPYYGGPEGFRHVFELIHGACEGFLQHLDPSGELARRRPLR